MNNPKIEELHKEFANSVRKYCKESDVTHMDLIIHILSVHHLFVLFFVHVGITPEEITNIMCESLSEGAEQEEYFKICLEGLNLAGELAEKFNIIFHKLLIDK